MGVKPVRVSLNFSSREEWHRGWPPSSDGVICPRFGRVCVIEMLGKLRDATCRAGGADNTY